MTVGGGRHLAHRLAVAQDQLLAEGDGVRVLEGELDEAAGDSRNFLAQKRLAADEIDALVQSDGEAEPGLVGGVIGGHVGAPGAIALLHAK